jgi:predicted GIY-YIG superfamily endonuclease
MVWHAPVQAEEGGVKTVVRADWVQQGTTVNGHLSVTPHRVHGARIEWRYGEMVLVIEARCGKEFTRPRLVLNRDNSKPCKACAAPSECVVYRAYNRQGRLLYVGMTGNLYRRMQTHRKESKWWRYCRCVVERHFDSRQAAAVAERAAIREEHPIFNRQFAVVTYRSMANRGPEGVGLRIHWRVSAFQPDDGPLQPPRVTLFGTDGVMLYDDLPVDAFAGLVEQLTTTLAEVRS